MGYLDQKYNKGCYIPKCLYVIEVFENAIRHMIILVLTWEFKMAANMAAEIFKNTNEIFEIVMHLVLCFEL